MYLVTRPVDDLVEVMVLRAPATGSAREVREDFRHLIRCKACHGTVALRQIVLYFRPAYCPLPQDTSNLRKTLLQFILVLQIGENRITDGVAPLRMELCHAGPVPLIRNTHIFQPIRNPGCLILVGPYPIQGDSQFLLNLILMAVQQIKTGLVPCRIPAAQIEVDSRSVIVGNALNGAFADSKESGYGIGCTGADIPKLPRCICCF